MEYLLNLNELRRQLDWMAAEGCDTVVVSVNDGSDLQPLSVSFSGSKTSCSETVIHFYEALDIRGDK